MDPTYPAVVQKNINIDASLMILWKFYFYVIEFVLS